MMKQFNMPTAFTILIGIIILMAVLTWIVPAGQYDYTPEGEPIPGTYHQTEQKGQGLGDIALAPLEGLYDAIDIAAFILMVGGFLGVVMKTGAIDAGIARIITRLQGREKYMIPILMLAFALGGTTFGMAEETIAFYPLLLPVFISAGYDAITAVSVIMIGAGIGVLGSTVNPFATGIAAGFAGVSLGQGILLRVLLLVVLLAIGIWYVMRYAQKVKENPQRSFVADWHERNKAHFSLESRGSEPPPLNGKRKAVLWLFALTFLVMIYAVIPFEDMGITWLPGLGWWFPELSALFFIAAILIGLFYRLKEKEIVVTFVQGAAELLSVAFIIGVSRGIMVVMNAGGITDTLLHWGEEALAGSGSIGFLLLTYLVYLPLSFLIPSTSGLATLSMPIMAPLADFAGVDRALVITAFQCASGIINLITPTSAVVMGGIAIGRIPYDRWIKFVWKLALLAFLICAGALLVGIVIG